MAAAKGRRYSPTASWRNRSTPSSSPSTAIIPMAGRASTDTADRALETVSRTAWGRFRAVDRASRGTSTRLMALKKTVGRASMGRVMPHTTPSSEMAWEGSMPPSTSF